MIYKINTGYTYHIEFDDQTEVERLRYELHQLNLKYGGRYPALIALRQQLGTGDGRKGTCHGCE